MEILRDKKIHEVWIKNVVTELEQLKEQLKELEEKLDNRKADLIQVRREVAQEIFAEFERYEITCISFNRPDWETLKSRFLEGK